MTKDLEINYASAVSQFEAAIKKFKVKKIIYQTIFRGKGLEFDSYRNFEPNDDAEMIDWKASLRTNQLLAKKYIEERDLDIYFLIDVSNNMIFGSRNRLKAEYIAEISAALAHLMIDSNDKIGLIMFSDKLVRVLRPSKTRNQFYLFTEYLADKSLYGSSTNFPSVLEYVLQTVKSPFSVIVMLSDFIHLHNNSRRLLSMISTRFETIALMVRDPLDDDISRMLNPIVVSDTVTTDQMLIDPKIAAAQYREYSLRQKKFVKELLKNNNIDLLELTTDKPFVIPLISFLRARAKGGIGE